jgi:hypothetical protein
MCGMPPKCITCKQYGHVRKNCPKFEKCNKFGHETEKCNLVNRLTGTAETDAQSNLNDDEITDDPLNIGIFDLNGSKFQSFMNQTNAEADQTVASSMPRLNGTEPQSTTAEVILVETVNSSASVFQIPVGTFTNQETTTLEIKQELVNRTDNKRLSRTKSRTAQARTGS